MAQVTAYREDIITYLKRLIQDGLPSDLTVTETANIYQGKGVYRHGPALPKLAQDCNLVPQQPTGAGLTLFTTHWSEWSFGIPEVSSPKGSSGIYNGSHASIMLLDFEFSAPWQHRQGAAHIYVTIENRTTSIHGTGLKRKILAIEPSARTGGRLIPGTDSEMGKTKLGVASSIGAGLSGSFSAGPNSPATLISEYVTTTSDQKCLAVWSFVVNANNQPTFPPRVRVGMIVQHQGTRGFFFNVETKASNRSILTRLLPSGAFNGGGKMYCKGVDSDRILSLQELRDFVKRGNMRSRT